MCHAWNRKRKNRLLRTKVEGVILANTNCNKKQTKKCNPQTTLSKCFFLPARKEPIVIVERTLDYIVLYLAKG